MTYTYVCVCVCVCVYSWDRKREGHLQELLAGHFWESLLPWFKECLQWEDCWAEEDFLWGTFIMLDLRARWLQGACKMQGTWNLLLKAVSGPGDSLMRIYAASAPVNEGVGGLSSLLYTQVSWHEVMIGGRWRVKPEKSVLVGTFHMVVKEGTWTTSV